MRRKTSTDRAAEFFRLTMPTLFSGILLHFVDLSLLVWDLAPASSAIHIPTSLFASHQTQVAVSHIDASNKRCDAPVSRTQQSSVADLFSLKSSPSLRHWHFSFCSNPRRLSFSFFSMRLSDAVCVSNSPMRSTASTCSSLDEAMRQSIFPADPFGLPTTRSRETRASAATGRVSKFPRLLWRCNLSARNLLSRDRSVDDVPTDNLRRHTYLFGTALRSSRATPREQSATPRSSTILLRENSEDLQLFREEAEYSDYISAHVTGQHIERPEDGVVFYEVQAHLSKQQWRVARRFSEFRTLRRQLIKHFSRGKRRHEPPCAICENVLASIVETTFPSRHVWGSHIFSSSSADALEDEIIDERKAQFQQFVAMLLLTIRSLRQHIRILPDSSTCEISVVLRMIEEFLGLSFARYLGFLGERGIVDQMPKSTRERLSLRG